MHKTLILFALAAGIWTLVWTLEPQDRPVRNPSQAAHPVPRPPTDGRVALGVRLSHPVVLQADPGSVALMLDVRAPPNGASKKSPMAIAVVMDRSGSMTGHKLAEAKRAAKRLVSALSDNDRFALVSYANDETLEVPFGSVGGRRKNIGHRIDEIYEGGGTHLSAGLVEGLKALRNAGPETPVRRLILISDGHANLGIQDDGAMARISEQAHQEGISISTLGVGLEFNEDLLSLLAENGGGRYSYAKDASAMGDIVDQEFFELSTLAAKNVTVHVKLRPGVKPGQAFGPLARQPQGQYALFVGDLSAHQSQRAILELYVPRESLGTHVLADVELVYTTPKSGRCQRHKSQVSFQVTTDPERVAHARDWEVEEARESAVLAQARNAAAVALSSGDKATAIHTLKKEISNARAKRFGQRTAHFEEQIAKTEKALGRLSNSAPGSNEAKDYIKSEKIRARNIFTY